MTEARSGLVGEYKKEFASFGWWFIGNKLDFDWTLSQLRESLRMTGMTDPEYLVLDRLTELCPKRPVEVLECLELLIGGTASGSILGAWKQRARPVLAELAKSGDSRVRDSAKRVINRLVARGHFEFKPLLSA